MDCQELQIALLDALKNAGEPLPPGGIEHLEKCPDCQEFRELWQHLGQLPVPLPDPGLSQRFQEQLQRERPSSKPTARFLAGWGLPLAATLLLTLGGAFAAGYSLRPTEPATPQQAALTQFRRGTTAHRMQTIALMTTTRGRDSNLVGALLERVTEDPSPEVRLSAVEALYIFGTEPSLGSRIAEALPRQEFPQVQLALVDLLVALRERRAAEALRRLVQENRLDPATQHHAEARLADQRL